MSQAFLKSYSGQSTDELLALEGQYRIDSLVLAFEQGIEQKTSTVSPEEQYVLAVEALEREVNNGGYDQFFVNSSNEFVSIIVPALGAINCPKTAAITQAAIDALGLGTQTSPARAEAAALAGSDEMEQALGTCDQRYFASGEPIADRLFDWIKANRTRISVGAG